MVDGGVKQRQKRGRVCQGAKGSKPGGKGFQVYIPETIDEWDVERRGHGGGAGLSPGHLLNLMAL